MTTKKYDKTSTLVLTFLALIILTMPSLAAVPGDVDPTFAGDGTLLDWDGYALTVAVQPDGRIVVAGMSYKDGTLMVARYDPDGSRDATFGAGSGKVRTNIAPGFAALDITLQPDGKIVAAGSSYDFNFGDPVNYLALIRYHPDGSLDTSFGGDGTVATVVGKGWSGVTSVATQPDGKIVVGVNSDIGVVLVRYLPNGPLDLTFGSDKPPNGKVTTEYFEGSAMLVQPDGKFVVVGRYGLAPGTLAVARYDPNGSLDTSFGTGGIFTTSIPGYDYFGFYCAVFQPDGKIIAAGTANKVGRALDLLLVRYDANGALDATFDLNGIVTTSIGPDSEVHSVALQPDGKILAAGGTVYHEGIPPNDFALVRYNIDGSLDSTFGRGDGITTVDFGYNVADSAFGMALDLEGRVVVAGASSIPGNNSPSFAIARFLLDTHSAPFDFDGDGRSDVSVYRPNDSVWYLDGSNAGFSATQFGTLTDKITPADFDGDEKTDIGVYRPGTATWYWLNSSNGTFNSVPFGTAEDLPTPADYDGDSRADVSVFRPSNGVWYRLNSTNGSFYAVQFGASEDKPTIGDFDGDGMADVAVFRPSNGAWYRLNSSNGQFIAVSFGLSDDLVTPADFDGDGATDIAVYRASTGTWYSLNSSNGAFNAVQFGIAEDLPSAADFDGDGKADISIFRPSSGIWYRLNSSDGGFVATQFGVNGDRPTPAAFRY